MVNCRLRICNRISCNRSRKDVSRIKGRVEHWPQKITSNTFHWWKTIYLPRLLCLWRAHSARWKQIRTLDIWRHLNNWILTIEDRTCTMYSLAQRIVYRWAQLDILKKGHKGAQSGNKWAQQDESGHKWTWSARLSLSFWSARPSWYRWSARWWSEAQEFGNISGAGEGSTIWRDQHEQSAGVSQGALLPHTDTVMKNLNLN